MKSIYDAHRAITLYKAKDRLHDLKRKLVEEGWEEDTAEILIRFLREGLTRQLREHGVR